MLLQRFIKQKFLKNKFDDRITKTIEDADFIYKLRKKNFSFGIGRVKIFQNHRDILRSLKNLCGHGKGDGEFIRKSITNSKHIVYIFIRYNLIYAFKAIFTLNFLALFFG